MANSYRDAIDGWPTLGALALDCGVPLSAVIQWRLVDAVPESFWRKFQASAVKQGLPKITDGDVVAWSESYSFVLTKWPDLRAVAADMGVTFDTVASWSRRNALPYRCWPALIKSAETRGIAGVSAETLMHAEERRYAEQIRRRSTSQLKRRATFAGKKTPVVEPEPPAKPARRPRRTAQTMQGEAAA